MPGKLYIISHISQFRSLLFWALLYTTLSNFPFFFKVGGAKSLDYCCYWLCYTTLSNFLFLFKGGVQISVVIGFVIQHCQTSFFFSRGEFRSLLLLALVYNTVRFHFFSRVGEGKS